MSAKAFFKSLHSFESLTLRQESAHRFVRRVPTISCGGGIVWEAKPNQIGVVFSSETPHSTSGNKNFASDAPSGKASSGDEVIDRTNAQTECLGCVMSGIEQLFYRSIHTQSPDGGSPEAGMGSGPWNFSVPWSSSLDPRMSNGNLVVYVSECLNGIRGAYPESPLGLRARFTAFQSQLS